VTGIGPDSVDDWTYDVIRSGYTSLDLSFDTVSWRHIYCALQYKNEMVAVIHLSGDGRGKFGASPTLSRNCEGSEAFFPILSQNTRHCSQIGALRGQEPVLAEGQDTEILAPAARFFYANSCSHTQQPVTGDPPLYATDRAARVRQFPNEEFAGAANRCASGLGLA
jgi:hypothetical protein